MTSDSSLSAVTPVDHFHHGHENPVGHRDELSSLTFLVMPLSFDFVQGSDACPDQNNGGFIIDKHSAVQFDSEAPSEA